MITSHVSGLVFVRAGNNGIWIDRMNPEVVKSEPYRPGDIYAGTVGRARAKVDVVAAREHFAAYASSWGCGMQDHMGDQIDYLQAIANGKGI